MSRNTPIKRDCCGCGKEFVDGTVGEKLNNRFCPTCRNVYQQGRADEREKIIKALENQKATEEDDSLAESVSTAIWNKAISRAIGIVKRGGENDR